MAGRVGTERLSYAAAAAKATTGTAAIPTIAARSAWGAVAPRRVAGQRRPKRCGIASKGLCAARVDRHRGAADAVGSVAEVFEQSQVSFASPSVAETASTAGCLERLIQLTKETGAAEDAIAKELSFITEVDRGYRDHAAAQDCMLAIVRATQLHPRSVPILLSAMVALDRISAGHAANSNGLVQAGGIEAIVEVMRQHAGVQRLQEIGCKLLLNATTCGPESKSKVVSAGGVRAVLGAMKAHPAVLCVQDFGCHALKELAAHSTSIQAEVYSLGGIQAVLRAMETHRSEVRIQVKACGVLRNIAATNSEHQEGIVQRGGVQSVMDSMKAHAEDADMQWAGCWALFCVCVKNTDMRREVVAHAPVSLVLSAMENHRSVARVQEGALWMLKELAENIGCGQSKSVLSQCVHAVLKAIEKHPTEDQIQQVARKVLQHLASHDCDGWVRTICSARRGRLGRNQALQMLEAIPE